MTITTERLRTIAGWREKYGNGHNVVIPAEEAEAIARELLAAREAVPVYQMRLLDGSPEQHTWAEVTYDEFNTPLKNPDEWEKRVLYTAPPATAVTTELLEAMEEVIRISDRDHEAWSRAKEALATCRAAMLGNGNSPEIQDGWKLVPVEPAESMVIDGFESDAFLSLADAVNESKGWPYGCAEAAECVTGIFKAMIAGVPAAPEVKGG